MNLPVSKLLLTGGLGLALLSGAGLFVTSVGAQNNTNQSAQQQQQFQHGWQKQQLDPAVKTQIDAAITAGNYAQWKSLVEQYMPNNTQLLEKITESNFAQFAQMHQLMQEAHDKMEQADTIRQELGLTRPGKGHMMKGFGRGMMMHRFGPETNANGNSSAQ